MSKANRWQIRLVRFDEIKTWDENPRKISDKALEGLRSSMERFGYVEPIVFNENTGRIVGGHQRFRILVEEGVAEANMVVVSLSDEEERAANITLNNPEIEGTFSDPALELTEFLENKDPDLFASLNIDALKEKLDKGKPSSDSVNEPENEEPESDTKCPCCGHEWKVSAKDISSIEGDA